MIWNHADHRELVQHLGMARPRLVLAHGRQLFSAGAD